MKVKESARDHRNWIEETSYNLMRSSGMAYSLFLSHFVVEASRRPINGSYALGAGVDRIGNCRLVVHFPSVERLSLKCSAELLKCVMLRYILGHISTRRARLVEIFGNAVFGMASDLVISQYVDVEVLSKEGFKLCTPDSMQLQKDQTTEMYCELLSTSKQGKRAAIDTTLREAYQDKTLADLEKAVGEGDVAESDYKPVFMNKPGPFMAVDIGTCPLDVVDTKLDTILEDVRNEAKTLIADSRGGAGRGWDCGEAMEFIKQIRRKPVVSWFMPLRTLESRMRSEVREISLKRPSRRHPDHFGRTKRNSLMVWFGIDVSGSMGTQQLEVIEPEFRGIYQRGATIMMLQIDSEIQKKTIWEPHMGMKTFMGRGGTDFSPFLFDLRDAVRSHRPGFAVFYTDGYGCISAYVAEQKKKMGVEAWDEFVKSNPTKTPEGVEMLWLLAEGTTSPERFRPYVPFGRIAVLPSAKREKEPAYA